MGLTEQQIDKFNAEGVLIVRGALDPQDLQPVIDELSTWVERKAQQLYQKGEIQKLHANESFQKRYGLLFKQSKKMGHGLDIMHSRGPAMFNFLSDKNLLDTIAPLVGSEITCNPIQHLRAKPPAQHEGHENPGFHNVPWHQDAGVMMAEAEDSNILTCWMPLTSSTQTSGCMRAMPGVSKRGYLTHISEGETMIDPSLLPDVTPMDLECEPGDIVLMNRFTPHCSTPNRADYCRWSIDLRFQTTGHHTGRTAHPAFVVRSADDASIMSNYKQWCDDWVEAFQNPRGFAGHRIHQ
jgi:phytanoyl-CoA hydroxylase